MYSIVWEDEECNCIKVAEAASQAASESPHLAYATGYDLVNTILDYTTSEDRIVITARDADNNVVGLVAGIMGYTNPTRPNCLTATESIWWVSKEHRKSSVGIRLMNEFEKWASTADCTVVSHYVDENGEVLSNLYKRKGYTPIEVAYIKENN